MLRAVGWGAIDQGFSSAANFALSVAAGRLLGPAGLGGIFVGFALYLILLGLIRAMVSEPLVAVSTSVAGAARREMDERGFLTALLITVAAAGVLGVSSTLLTAEVREGLTAFSLWVPPALLSDYFRTLLFRDQRGRWAAVTSGSWFLTTIILLILAQERASISTMTAAWGLGGTVAAGGNYLAYRFRIRQVIPALSWWWRKIWPAGRWLGLGSILVTTGTYAVAVILGLLIGPEELGGLRAVQSLFAPLSLIGPAFTLPGLPLLARLVLEDPAEALSKARALSLRVASIVVVVVVVLGLAGAQLLASVFGLDFARFAPVIVPVGFAQIAEAGSLGFILLFKAERRALELLAGGAIASGGSLFFASVLGAAIGVLGAAWGLAFAPIFVFAYLSVRASPRKQVSEMQSPQ